jgi:hypothetical protein
MWKVRSMNKLTLSQWANIAEIGASVILILGLAYVGLGLDRNTKAVHSETWQAVVEKLIDLNVAEASTPELSRVVVLGESSPLQLTAEEWWRYSKFAESRLGQMEFAYLARTNDTLGESYWVALEGYLEEMVCKPGYRRFWSQNGESSYHVDFFDYVAGVIRNCDEK